MSVERVKVIVDNSIKAEDLDPAKLAFISFGSLCGMGIGFFLSFVFTGSTTKLILASVLLCTGFYLIMKALPMLRK